MSEVTEVRSESPPRTPSGAAGGSGHSTASALRAAVSGMGVSTESLVSEVYITCVDANKEEAEFVRNTFLELEYTAIALSCDSPPQQAVARVTASDCVVILLSPEAVESLYDVEEGLGAQIKVTMETHSKYILLATPTFKWNVVDPKKLAWGVKDLYLEDPLLVELSAAFRESLEGKLSVPSNASPYMSVIRTLILVLLTALVPAAFLVTFSEVGYGTTVFKFLSAWYGWPAVIALAGGGGILFFLYLFDFSYWEGKGVLVLKRVLIVLALLCLAVGIVMTAREYPALPQALFMLIVPCYVFVVKRVFFRRQEISAYLGSLSIALSVTFAMEIAAWIYYLAQPGIGM